MTTKDLIGWSLPVLAFLLGLIVMPFLPPLVASHWGISGEVNGYQSKWSAVLFLPALSLILYAGLHFLPRLDPLRKNIQLFRKHYDNFVLFLTAFLTYLQLLILIWNLGFKFNIMLFLTPAFALLIYGLGTVLPEARPNWIFGIRTPWTMSDGRVWFHTHELAGRVYKAAGVLTLGAFFWPAWAGYFLLGPLLAGSAYLLVFSYLDWRRENN